MIEKRVLLTRRRALQGAASILGGTITAFQFGALASRAAIAATSGRQPAFFDSDQFALVERMVDVIVPETDTPGAYAAGAHHFIDLMMSEWASPERRARFAEGVAALDRALRGPAGEPFVQLTAAHQLELLRNADAAAFDAPSGNDFFEEFKRITLFAYYSTEVGATKELQFEELPGSYRPCITMDDDVRAWFHLGYRNGL